MLFSVVLGVFGVFATDGFAMVVEEVNPLSRIWFASPAMMAENSDPRYEELRGL